jgi:hypothetical protein
MSPISRVLILDEHGSLLATRVFCFCSESTARANRLR